MDHDQSAYGETGEEFCSGLPLDGENWVDWSERTPCIQICQGRFKIYLHRNGGIEQDG